MEEKSLEKLKKEGVKYDGNKLRFDLLPFDALIEVVKVYTFGALKYLPDNWRKGLKWSRVFGALCRHSIAWFLGEEKDVETGIHHMAHAAWCCLTLMNYSKTHVDLDDRYKFDFDFNFDLPEQAIEFLKKFKVENN